MLIHIYQFGRLDALLLVHEGMFLDVINTLITEEEITEATISWQINV